MPSYKVIKPGFFHGRLYDPLGKRPVLHIDKPFPFKKDEKTGKNTKVEDVPSWLEPGKPETAAQVKKRIAAETKAANAAAEKSEADQKEIDEASFMGAGEKSSTVETL